MTMYQLEFTDDDQGRTRYEICYNAVVRSDKAPELGDWDDCIELLKKLKAAGEPDKAAVVGGGKVTKKTLYDLQDGGAIVVLERSEYKFLLGLVGRPIWPTIHIEDAQETRKWLDGLRSDGGSAKVDAKPEARRKAASLVD